MKLSPKQKEVVGKMRDGWSFGIGQDEDTGYVFYYICQSGCKTIYFKSTVFANLLNKELIHQDLSPPFRYQLTELGKTISL